MILIFYFKILFARFVPPDARDAISNSQGRRRLYRPSQGHPQHLVREKNKKLMEDDLVLQILVISI